MAQGQLARPDRGNHDIPTMLRALEMPTIVVSHTADVLDIASRVIRLQRPPLGATQLAA